MSKTNKYSPEVRERAVRLVQEARKDRPSLWAAVESIAPMIGCSTVTLHEWVKKHEVDTGVRDGIPTAERERIKALEREVKELRKDKQYLLIGMRLNRDTERMVMSDMIYAAAQPAGWVLIQEPTDKERRFCKKIGLEILESDVFEFIGAAQAA